MNPDQIEKFLGQLDHGKITGREAIALLVAAGVDEQAAREAVFIELGGSDRIVIGKDGVARYDPSGEAVEKLARSIDS